MNFIKKAALLLGTCVLSAGMLITSVSAEATLLADWGDMSQAAEANGKLQGVNAKTGDYRLYGTSGYNAKTLAAAGGTHLGLGFQSGGLTYGEVETKDGADYAQGIFEAIDSSFTFETWIHMAPGTGGVFVLRSGTRDLGRLNTVASGGRQNLTFERIFDDNGTEKSVYFATQSTFMPNTWNHIVFSYDSSSPANEPLIVINGVKSALTAGASNPTKGTVVPFNKNENGYTLLLGQYKPNVASASFLQNGFYSELRFYSGCMTEAEAIAQYEKTMDYFMPNYSVMLNGTENISAVKEKAIQENQFSLSVDISPVSATDIEKLITFKNTDDNSTAVTGVLSGSNLVFNSDFLAQGVYELVISKEIKDTSGNAYRNADKKIKFTVSENTALRAQYISEINALLANTAKTDADLAEEIIRDYNRVLKLDVEAGSDYSKIINKNQIFAALRKKTDYADLSAFAQAFAQETVLQKDRDVKAAVGEVNGVGASTEEDKVGLMKSLLFAKYQTVFQLDTAEYDLLQNKDAVISSLIALNISSPDDMASAFKNAVSSQKAAERTAEFFARLENATVQTLLSDLTAYSDVVKVDLTDKFFTANQDAVLTALIAAKPKTPDAFEKAFYGYVVINGFNNTAAGDRDSILLLLNSYQKHWSVPQKYTSLNSDEERLEVCKKLSGVKITNPDELSQKVEAICSELGEEPQTNNRPNRGGGGGGGGSFSTDAKQPVPQIPATPVEAKLPFTDIDNVEWAREGIRYLFDLGVVNGRTENTFAPMESVTRNEIAKMLSLAFGIKTDSTDKKFTDIGKEHWAYPYVAAIFDAGIMNGKGEMLFDGNAPLSRAELAVIAKRIMEYKSIAASASEDNTAFADDASIPEYAKAAIYEMRRAGVMAGEGNNQFNPAGNVTRAAAAKVIHFITTIKTGGAK